MEKAEKIAVALAILLLFIGFASSFYSIKEKGIEGARTIFLFSFKGREEISMNDLMKEFGIDVSNKSILLENYNESRKYKWNEIKSANLKRDGIYNEIYFDEPYLIKIGNISIIIFENICKGEIELEKIINLSKVSEPEKHRYTIIGEDGYQQTVEWEDIKKGVLNEKRKVTFPHLPKKFWVKNVFKIEVVE